MNENSNPSDILMDDMDLETPDHAWKTVGRLWRSIGRQRKRLAVVLVSVIFYTLLSIAAPIYSAGVVDLLWDKVKEALQGGAVFRITWADGGSRIFFLLLIYLAAALFYALQSFLMASFAETLSLGLRTEIGAKLNRLPLSFFDRTRTGTILSCTVNDLDKTAEALQTGMLKLFTAVGMVVGSLIMMFRFSILLTCIFLAFMGLALAATKLAAAKTLQYASERQRCVAAVTAYTEEAYSGRAVIRAFNREQRSAEAMHQAADELAGAAQKAEFMMNAVNPGIRLINRFGQVLIAVFAGKMLLDGSLTVGAFQAFFQYVNQSSEPLTEMAYMVNSMQSALASLERIYSLLDEEEEAADPAVPSRVACAEGSVEFQDVSFGYTPDRLFMRNISFSVKPGQKVAIVGSTGAGKTTLVNLLMRFYEVSGGTIRLDGKDIRELTRPGLREHFGMVLQDTWLFGGTIAENIAYGRPGASREEVIAAAKAARGDFCVRTMPRGYDTVLSGDAETISAGQRQLLTIARVFLRNPAVLILDEATSSVDTRTEAEISKAMKALMHGRTSFVIAHRLSTIVDADVILLMQNGTIIEQGSHEALLRANGAYAELYNSQFL